MRSTEEYSGPRKRLHRMPVGLYDRPMRKLELSMPLVALGLIGGAGLMGQTPAPLIDNDQVRVLKVTDQPHAKGKPHEHKVNRVMIYLQPGTQEITADGKKTVQHWKAGEVRWSPATGTHVSELTSDAPVTIIEVEVKKEG